MPNLATFDPTKPLDNPRHERFCQLVAKGASDLEAYHATHDECTRESAHSNAWRLKADEGIRDRIKALVAPPDSLVLSLAEKRKFLRDIVKTPIGNVDESSELAQEVTYDRETGQRTKLKVPDKLKALELDAKLAGELDSERNERPMVNINLLGIAPASDFRVVEQESGIENGHSS